MVEGGVLAIEIGLRDPTGLRATPQTKTWMPLSWIRHQPCSGGRPSGVRVSMY